MIYLECLEIEKEERVLSMEVKSRHLANAAPTLASDTNYENQAQKQKRFQEQCRARDEARRDFLYKTVQRQRKQTKNSTVGLSPRAREAFERYQLQHEMYTPYDYGYLWFKPLYGGLVDTKGSWDLWETKKSIAIVTLRGDVVNDLPMLSFVNREIFRDTFHLVYSSVGEGLRIMWMVRHLDFLPFLRFYQSLTKTLSPHNNGSSKLHKSGPLESKEIGPSRITICFDKKGEEWDYSLHMGKFSQVKRLIELHWLDGFPLWGCLTRLSDDDYRNCEGPSGDCMYSVRQIVALYRVDLET
jgi:hypothetical protein